MLELDLPPDRRRGLVRLLARISSDYLAEMSATEDGQTSPAAEDTARELTTPGLRASPASYTQAGRSDAGAAFAAPMKKPPERLALSGG